MRKWEICKHKGKTYEIFNYRRNYPFGRKSKPRYTTPKQIVTKCCNCKETVSKVNLRR